MPSSGAALPEITGADIAAAELHARLAANLHALRNVHPEVHASLLAAGTPREVHIGAGEFRAVTLLLAHRRLEIATANVAANLQQIRSHNFATPVFLLVGAGAGHELLEAFAATRRSMLDLPGAKLPVHLVLADVAELWAALTLHDLTGLLAERRLLFFTGAAAAEQYRAFLHGSHQTLTPHLLIMASGTAAQPCAQQCIRHVQDRINFIATHESYLQRAVNDYYKSVSNAAWRRQFSRARPRPPRVLAITSRFSTFVQYCMRDLLQGFAQLGCVTSLYTEDSDIARPTRLSLLDRLHAFRPDLIVMIDHFRGEFPSIPDSVPFVNWIQDLLPHIREPENLRLGARDYTFAFSRDWIADLRAREPYRKHDIHFLPVGMNTAVYHPLPETPKDVDVLFVSHLPDPSTTLMPLRDARYGFTILDDEAPILNEGHLRNEQLQTCYRLMAQRIDAVPMDEVWLYKIDTEKRRVLVEEVLREAGLQPPQRLIDLVYGSDRLYNDIYFIVKTRPVRALMESGVNVHAYGRNWEQYGAFAAVAHGVAENGAPLNALMNRARVCLNNSPGTSLHMRVPEILGAGAFMLSRRIPLDISPLTDFFREGDEVVFFTNERDVVERVRHYLDHEDERARIAAAAHRKAVATFGYEVIAQTILDTVAARL
jgi:spore maturation protein CgeB